MTENFDINEALKILSQLGLSPEQLGPEKFGMLTKLADTIKNPGDINNEVASKIFRELGIEPTKKHDKKEKNIKIGRNELCFCNSGKKYKKCCFINNMKDNV